MKYLKPNPNLQFIWTGLMNDRGRHLAYLTLITVFIGAALQTAAPYGLGLMIDALGTRDQDALLWGGLVYITLELTGYGIGWCRQRVRERLFQQNFWYMPQTLTRLFFARPLGKLAGENSEIDGGGIESMKGKVWNIIDTHIFSIFPNYGLAVFGIIACGLMSPTIGIVALCYGVLELAIGRRQNHYIHTRMLPIIDDFRQWERRMREWWGAIPLIKSNGAESRIIAKIHDDIQPVLERDDAVWRIYFANAILKRRLLSLAFASVVYSYAGYLVFTDQMAVASCVLVFFSFERIRVVLSDISDLQRTVQYDITSMDKPRLVLQEPNSFLYNEGIPFVDDEIGIRFTNVSLTLGREDERRDILREVSFTIEPGERIGIVGPSGAGKSQLLSLILRASDPDTGAVFINDHDLRALSLETFTRNIGNIPQQSVPFEDTVLGNITFGVSHFDWLTLVEAEGVEERASDTIRKAGLDFGGRLTHGLQTKLGYKGMRLSGGQQARLRIADAHFKIASHLPRPRLILADEPTASLDSLSETKVLEHLNDSLPLGTTVLMIAHRLSTVADMDRIMFVRPLEQCLPGEIQITMHASLAELYSVSALFREMADAQGFRPQ